MVSGRGRYMSVEPQRSDWKADYAHYANDSLQCKTASCSPAMDAWMIGVSVKRRLLFWKALVSSCARKT